MPYARILLLFIALLPPRFVMGIDCNSAVKLLSNPQTSYEKKLSIADQAYGETTSCQLEIFEIVLKESIKRKDLNNALKFYSGIAHAHLFEGNLDSCKHYLNLASAILKRVDDTDALGIYNHAHGDYCNRQHDYQNSHSHYYKAIDYFKKNKTKTTQHNRRSASMLNSMAFSYLQENDTSSVKTILGMMHQEVLDLKDRRVESIYYGLLSYYYGSKYTQVNNELFLDSAIICDEKVIHLYETAPDKKDFYSNEMAYRYVNLSNNKLKKEKPDYQEINRLAQEACALSNPTDTAMLINCLWVESYTLYELKEIKESETKLLTLIQFMDSWTGGKDLEMYSNLCHLLTSIYTSYGDYKQALKYAQKKQEYDLSLYNAEKFRIIKELQTKYETAQKEEQIKTQKKINLFIGCIALLLIIIAFFIINWLRINRRMLSKQLDMIKQEKCHIEKTLEGQDRELKKAKIKEQEISIKIQEKEKLINDTKLQALSDLIDAQQEIQLLKDQQRLLEETIMVAEANKTSRQQQRDEILINIHSIIKHSTSIPEAKKENIFHMVSQIDDSSILLLKNKGLNTLDIEYSVLIAAGLKISEIGSVYCVVEQTVRTRRSKIREAFNLDASDNLDNFLLRFLLIPLKKNAE